MQRYKLFTSAVCDDDLAQFERLVDEWLVAERPQVQLLAQSALGTHVMLSVLYLQNDPDAALASEETAVPEVFERTLEDADLDPNDAPDTTLPEVELPY